MHEASRKAVEDNYMLGRWGNDFWAQLAQPGGWSLAVKGLAGVIAFLAGTVSVISFRDSHRAQIADSIHNRMASIQSGLLSENESARLAALRSLRSFASDQTVAQVSDPTLRAEAWVFARRVLIEAIASSKLEAQGVVVASMAPGKSQPSPVERYELLATFDDVGLHGWFAPVEKDVDLSPENYVLDFLWISRAGGSRPSLSAIEPSSALAGFNFTGLRLDKSRFDCVPLINAVFDKAGMKQVRFVNAQLENASFVSGQLEYASFAGSALHAARFDDSEITGSAFTTPATLSNAQHEHTPCAAFPQPDLSTHGTSAVYASFKNAHIYESDFSGAMLAATRFDGVLLSNVHFNSANLNGALLADAQISGSFFNSAQMEGASLAGATLSAVAFDDTILKNVNFRGAHFTDTQSAQSLLKAKSVEGANFSGASGIDDQEACELIKAGGVLVDQEREWSADGRQRTTMSQFESDRDKQLLATCGA